MTQSTRTSSWSSSLPQRPSVRWEDNEPDSSGWGDDGPASSKSQVKRRQPQHSLPSKPALHAVLRKSSGVRWDDKEPDASGWGDDEVEASSSNLTELDPNAQQFLPLPGQPAPHAVFQKPVRIDSFSYGPHRTLHLDDRAKRNYVQPPTNADLAYGFERAVWREEKNEHLDALLTSLMAGNHGTELSRTSLVTWRGMMTKLCTAIFTKQDRYPTSWAMNVMLVGSTMYIEEHVTAQSLKRKAEQQADERQRKMSYFGYSFEQYCCAPDAATAPLPDIPQGWSGDVDTNEQWCEVIRTKLGEQRVIIAGETDCVKPSGSVELKTSMQIRTQFDEIKFEQKMLRFYMQSFLLGAPHVVVGFRDQDGKLVAHQEFNTLAMPRLVRGKPHGWNPQYGLDYGASVIAWTHNTLSRAHATEVPDPSKPQVWRLELATPFDHISLRRLSDEEVRTEVQEGLEDDRAGFLTREYFDWLNNGFKVI